MQVVFVVTLWARYGYDDEVHGNLAVFSDEQSAANFVADLKDNWEIFKKDWINEDNRWGSRFYLSGAPRDLAETDLSVVPWEVK